MIWLHFTLFLLKYLFVSVWFIFFIMFNRCHGIPRSQGAFMRSAEFNQILSCHLPRKLRDSSPWIYLCVMCYIASWDDVHGNRQLIHSVYYILGLSSAIFVFAYFNSWQLHEVGMSSSPLYVWRRWDTGVDYLAQNQTGETRLWTLQSCSWIRVINPNVSLWPPWSSIPLLLF